MEVRGRGRRRRRGKWVATGGGEGRAGKGDPDPSEDGGQWTLLRVPAARHARAVGVSGRNPARHRRPPRRSATTAAAGGDGAHSGEDGGSQTDEARRDGWGGGGGGAGGGLDVATRAAAPPRVARSQQQKDPPLRGRSSLACPLPRHPSQGQTWHALNDDRRLRRQLTAHRRTRHRRLMVPPGGPSAVTSWRPQGGEVNTTQGASAHCPVGWRGRP